MKNKIKKHVLKHFDSQLKKDVLKYLLKYDVKTIEDFRNVLTCYYEKVHHPNINLVSFFNKNKKYILDLIYSDIDRSIIDIEIGSPTEKDTIIVYGCTFEIDNNKYIINKRYTQSEKENLALYSFDRTIETLYCDIDY